MYITNNEGNRIRNGSEIALFSYRFEEIVEEIFEKTGYEIERNNKQITEVLLSKIDELLIDLEKISFVY